MTIQTMSLAGKGDYTVPFLCDLHSVALEGLLPAVLCSCLWLLCVNICFVLNGMVVSNLSFCTLHFFFSLLPPLFSLLCLIFVVLGDTYNIPLDPRGKQTYPHVPVHIALDSDVC